MPVPTSPTPHTTPEPPLPRAAAATLPTLTVLNAVPPLPALLFLPLNPTLLSRASEWKCIGVWVCITQAPMVGSHSHARELHASHFIPPLLCVHGWDMNTSRICPTFYGSTCIVVATSRYVESFTLLTLSVHVNLAALYIYCAFFEHFQQGHNFVRLINSSCKNLR